VAPAQLHPNGWGLRSYRRSRSSVVCRIGLALHPYSGSCFNNIEKIKRRWSGFLFVRVKTPLYLLDTRSPTRIGRIDMLRSFLKRRRYLSGEMMKV
jgi:hypothetical protein